MTDHAVQSLFKPVLEKGEALCNQTTAILSHLYFLHNYGDCISPEDRILKSESVRAALYDLSDFAHQAAQMIPLDSGDAASIGPLLSSSDGAPPS